MRLSVLALTTAWTIVRGLAANLSGANGTKFNKCNVCGGFGTRGRFYESAALPTELPRRLFDCNIRGKKLSNFGRVWCVAWERPVGALDMTCRDGLLAHLMHRAGTICSHALRRLRHHGILQREIGYISQATPTPTSTKSAKDQSAYLTPPVLVRCVRHASATETSSANSSIAPRWLSRGALLMA